MCCFSPVAAPIGLFARLFARSPKPHVSNTNIFARLLDASTQGLVYSMQLSVAGEVAMILPVPVARGSGEEGLEFVSLDEHPRFFSRLSDLFMVPMTAAPRSKSGFHVSLPELPKLRVHNVGSFEASFVPTMKDFGRLDERFRLPENIWREIGGYDDDGFAVFRLAPGKKARIHPMAFRFRTRDPSRLFFPTVHVHDGKVHPSAGFDHSLYYQGLIAERDERSFLAAPIDIHPIVEPGQPVFRRSLRGRLPNRDTWIAVSSTVGEPAGSRRAA